MVDKIISGVKEKMEKTTEYFRQELKGIRTGRATLTVFENIKVNYYGTLAPISTIATLHIADPHMITIGPWDTSIIKDIEKAILSSNLGFNPSNDGKLIRVPVPSLTEERRKDLTKAVKKMAEDTKVILRNERRAGIDLIKKVEKDKEISEDECTRYIDELQTLTDEYIKKLDMTTEKKIDEIMEI